MENQLKSHWENVYQTKGPDQVSWTQDKPSTSLNYIESFKLNKSASIIDIGGGDSKLVDYLLELGYTDITVLDISATSIEKAKTRLGKNASKINWIVSDILEFVPTRKYDIWHDRAAFHFLTESMHIEKYLKIVSGYAKNIIIATFSVDGPFKCSGLEIKQYDENSMKSKFENSGFVNIECSRSDHTTPMGTIQNFVFCAFKNDSVLN